MATLYCTCSNSIRQPGLCLIHQSIFTGQPVEIGPAEAIPENGLPDLVSMGGQQVHAPVLTEDGMLIVDTGESILELTQVELDVLRAVLFCWDVAEVLPL